MSAVARFVIDDEPLDGMKAGPFDAGGALTLIDARARSARRPLAGFVLLAVLLVAVVGVSVLGVAQREHPREPSRSVDAGGRLDASRAPALVLGAGASLDDMAARTVERAHARRR